jgi:hypothetical protein
MKKADLAQALAEEAAEHITNAITVKPQKLFDRQQAALYAEIANVEQYAAGINLAAINHINGVSPTQE